MKVCILAYWYPPLQAVGALRTQSFVKYASENDVEAFVVSIEPNKLCTPQANEEAIEEKVYRIPGFDCNFFLRNFLKRIRGKSQENSKDQYSANQGKQSSLMSSIKSLLYFIYRMILCFPDTHFLWFFFGKNAFLKIIEEENPDVVLTSAFPVSSFLFGRLVKKKYPHIKWVADYRDLWSQHQWYRRPWPLASIEESYERKVLSSAELIITTSKEFQKQLEALHQRVDLIPIVYNGFDEDINQKTVESKKFKVVYTGLLYEQQRPDLFFQAIKELITSGDVDKSLLSIDFYGKMPTYLSTMLSEFELEACAKIHGLVARELVIQAQRQSHIALLIRWDEGPLHVKVFEYLSARVPILALVHENSEIADVVNEANAGLVTSSVDEIKSFIKEEYELFKCNSSNRLVEESPVIRRFSRKEQAKSLYNLLNTL